MTDKSSAFALSTTPKAAPEVSGAVSHGGIDILDEEHGPARSIEWRDITVHARVKAKKGAVGTAPPVLDAVSAFAAPGELLVVLGPPGAGKSTLLSVLSGQAAGRATAESDVRLGLQPLTALSARRHVALVAPNDLFFNSLSVREHLVFQARFHRAHTRHSESELQRRVDHVLRENGLEEVGGSPIGALSAGLKKRLAIASALVGHASVLLVDEPTQGLDTFAAAAVVSQLKHIASSGSKTVVAAVSKPSSQLFALFDKLLLLGAGGKVVYHGPASSAVGYFAEHGHQCPPYFSAADYLVATVSVAPALLSLPWEDAGHASHVQIDNADAARIDALAHAWEAYRQSDAYKAMLLPHHAAVIEPGPEHDRESLKGPPALSAARSLTSCAPFNVTVLARRNVARLLNKTTVLAITVQPVVVSVVVGLIYLQPDMDQLGMQTLSSVFFVFTVVMTMMNAIAQLATMPSELALVQREHQAGLYHVASWYLVKNVTELPLQIIRPLFFLVPAYFMVGIGHGADLFFYLAVILALVSSAAVGYGYMISCVARRTGAVVPIGFAILIPMLILGGVLVNPKSIRDYLVWVAYISPFKYCFEALMNLFWERVDTISCYPAATCSTTSGLAVLAARSLTDRTPWTSGLLLVALNLSFRLLGLLALLVVG